MPVRLVVTAGTAADCCSTGEIEGMDADYRLADRAYDTDELLELCAKQGTEAVIPAKRNRKQRRE